MLVSSHTERGLTEFVGLDVYFHVESLITVEREVQPIIMILNP
jgi:hypothetical protein